jgi:uncharacterized membrane protein
MNKKLQGSRILKVDIRKELGISKSTISDIIKRNKVV